VTPQSVPNAAAQLIFRLRRSDLITDALVSLRWLRDCECLKGLFLGSPCIHMQTELSMAMPRSTYGSSHRSPTSRLDKDRGLLHQTIYSFLLSDCLLLDVALPCCRCSHMERPTAPVDVTSAPSLLTFRKRLNLHLF